MMMMMMMSGNCKGRMLMGTRHKTNAAATHALCNLYAAIHTMFAGCSDLSTESWISQKQRDIKEPAAGARMTPPSQRATTAGNATANQTALLCAIVCKHK
jgi:hypothetical protein